MGVGCKKIWVFSPDADGVIYADAGIGWWPVALRTVGCGVIDWMSSCRTSVPGTRMQHHQFAALLNRLRWSIVFNTLKHRPIESHSGVRGNILARPPKHISGAPLGRKSLNFSFENGAFWCTLYFWATAGPPNVAEPGVAYPPTAPFWRACWNMHHSYCFYLFIG